MAGQKTEVRHPIYGAYPGNIASSKGGIATPNTLFITCSDLREDPSFITRTKSSQLMVMRNAGNLVPIWGKDSSIDAAIEHAVAVMGVQNIIVCGHVGCAAIASALHPHALDNLPSVRSWIAHAHPHLQTTAHLEGEERITKSIAVNATAQLDYLLTHPSVSRAVQAGALTLHGWVYNVSTARVQRLDSRKEAA